MPDDIFYGGDVEARIGRRADAATPPTTWTPFEFMQLTLSPTQEWRARNKLGRAGTRRNPLDPTRPRKGFFRLAGELTVDADSRYLPLLLRHALGAPVTTAAGDLFTHAFESGSKAEQYFDLVLKVGDAKFRAFEGLTLAQISFAFSGENTQDYDINVSLAGLDRKRLTAWPSGTVADALDEAPILRTVFEIDDVAPSNTLSGSWSYTRELQEGVYLTATPRVTNQKPNGAQHAGSATYRALGDIYDQMEEDEETFAAAFRMLGVLEDHEILLQHPASLLAPSPLPVNGVGMVERTLNWSPHQTAAAAAARIVITNDIGSYT